MSGYKTYKKQKIIYFVLSLAAYFLPFTITAACLLPFIKAASGLKAALGLGIVAVNAVPFLTGVFKAFFAHFPMLNVIAVAWLFVAGFFYFDVFMKCREIFCWIELAAAIGSIASCLLWVKYLKYRDYNKTMKAAIGSGAFELKGAKDD